MITHQALEREGGRFDFGWTTDSGDTHPVGYCAGWLFDQRAAHARESIQDPELLAAQLANLAEERERAAPFRAKYHEDGHATKAEAKACYREFCLDQRLLFGQDDEAQKRCELCGEWTEGRATLNPRGRIAIEFVLCARHQNPEGVAQALEAKAEPGELPAKSVIINARQRKVSSESLTFTELCELAGVAGDATCTYLGPRRGGPRAQGELQKGGSVEVVDGMIFNLSVTGKA